MRKLILVFAGLAFLCQAANAQTTPAPEPTAPPEQKGAPDVRIKKDPRGAQDRVRSHPAPAISK